MSSPAGFFVSGGARPARGRPCFESILSDASPATETILEEFSELYKVQAAIVHQGKSRLSSHEERMIHKFRWIGMRVIREECRLLQRDRKG